MPGSTAKCCSWSPMARITPVENPWSKPYAGCRKKMVPTVYSIGILGEEKQRRARRALQTMSERTGGISFLPKTLDEVDEISKTVARDIRNQYTIGYKPTNPRGNGRISVDSCGRQGQGLRKTRRSYQERILRSQRNRKACRPIGPRCFRSTGPK